MSITVFPNDGYDSFISEADADTYFSSRLNADQWATADKEAALKTAFRSLSELDIVITDSTDAATLQALASANAEQALHELVNISSMDGQAFSGLQLGGLLSVKIPENKTPPARFSPRAMAMLRPYLQGKTIARTR